MTYGSKNGANGFSTETRLASISARAIEAGINFFDTADVYSLGVSEEITGRWPTRDGRARPTCGRDQSSWPDGRGSEPARTSAASTSSKPCEDSLRRLGIDYVDLYQIHRWDHTTPIEETLEALDSLVRAGKVRYLGASSMAAWQFSKALYTAARMRWQPLCLDAEPLQPGLSRGRARDDPALPRSGRRA